MKTLHSPLKFSILTLLLVAMSGLCFAMMGLDMVTKDRAKALGMEIRTTAAGPDAVRVELAFKPEGELKNFSRVDLEMNQDGKLLISSSLREEKPGTGQVVVSFAADRANLDKITLRVVTGLGVGSASRVAYDLRVKDFVDLEKLR